MAKWGLAASWSAKKVLRPEKLDWGVGRWLLTFLSILIGNSLKCQPALAGLRVWDLGSVSPLLSNRHPTNMDQVMQFLEPGWQFVKDSIQLVKRCTKPDRKEFQKIAMATAIGFAIMRFIGFFVKLIHIPINNIIMGGWVLFHHGTSEPVRGWQAHEIKHCLEKKRERDLPGIPQWGVWLS